MFFSAGFFTFTDDDNVFFWHKGCSDPLIRVPCSADAGWDDLKGYDMSSGSSNMITQFVGGGNDIFVVQVRGDE